MSDTNRATDVRLHRPLMENPNLRGFGAEHRMEAARQATEMGRGVLMMIHSGHTEFYASTRVDIGKVEVHASRQYKGWPEFVTVLESPEQSFDYAELHEWVRADGDQP